MPEDIAAVRRFLLEYLPPGEVPQTDPVLEEWRRASIPFWRIRLKDARAAGDTDAVSHARWKLTEVLGVDETERSDLIPADL